MLRLTYTAAEAVRGLVADSPVIPDETGGVRLFAGTESGAQIHLSGAKSPHKDDFVIEAEGARVFVEADLAPRLSDKTLDAEVSSEGVGFRIIEQEAGPASDRPAG